MTIDALVWVPRMMYYRAFQQGLPEEWFTGAVVVRDLAVVALCVLVLRQIYRPADDLVRFGFIDDPAVASLDQAEDAPPRWLPPWLRPKVPPARSRNRSTRGRECPSGRSDPQSGERFERKIPDTNHTARVEPTATGTQPAVAVLSRRRPRTDRNTHTTYATTSTTAAATPTRCTAARRTSKQQRVQHSRAAAQRTVEAQQRLRGAGRDGSTGPVGFARTTKPQTANAAAATAAGAARRRSPRCAGGTVTGSSASQGCRRGAEPRFTASAPSSR